MDLFKKGTLKSQSLNSRFLASNPQSSNYTRTQPIQSVKPSAPTSNNVNAQPSKLKLTTSRQSSALRLNREQNSSPGVNDQSQSIAKDAAAERKAPVWNKGIAPVKSAKDYTDEELKAMHGISLVSRKSENANVSKEGRWDDSDEDDDWGDTIDFGDGTKVTIGQTATNATAEVAKVVPEPTPPKPVEPVVKHFAFPPPRGEGSPWKRSEPMVNSPMAVADFPPVSASKAPTETKPATATIEMPPRVPTHGQTLNVRSPQEYSYEQRPRAESFNKDGRMQQSGDARYSYEQNTYDRHWQNPVPQTREIYNSTTGRFEQIEAVQKVARRPSHSERRTNEVPGRHQAVSGDARKQGAEVSLSKTQRPTPATQTKVETNGHIPLSIATDVNAAKEPTKDEAIDSKKQDSEGVPDTAPLDPSSREFIDMQKTLMAERREQAIQRRKDQEAEDVARKERARKKAAELAAQAEEAQKEIAAQAELEKSKSRPQLKLASRGSLDIEKNIASQQAVSEAIQTRSKAPGHVQGSSVAAVERPKPETWQRSEQTSKGNKSVVAEDRSFEKGIGPHNAKSGIHSIDRSPRARTTNAPPKDDANTPSRNVWGPIGPQNGSNTQVRNQNRSETILGSFGLDDPSTSTQQAQNGIKSPPPMSRSSENIASPSWSAFDGIARSRNMTTPNENRNYNVFDAADEVITPERHRNSPPGQSQANRTSSRFFPSAVQAATSPKSVKSSQPFVSPALPPRLDADNANFFDTGNVAPVISLPEAQIEWSRKNGAPTTKEAKHTRHGGRVWLDTQTRSVWEIKPLRDGQAPRIKVPHSEKQLDWSRKERPTPSLLPGVSQIKEEAQKIAKSAITAIPAIPAWTLPKILEITSKASSVAEPLIPPQPALKLPNDANESIQIEPLSKKRKVNRFLEDKFGRYYTTKPSLHEENDIMSPIRVKTTSAETKVSRKFGKRVDPNQTGAKKVSDVKRQPVNMSDAPGGAGFKRGFANRVRVPNTNSTTTSSKSTTPNPESKSAGQSGQVAEPAQQTSVSILQRTMGVPEGSPAEGRIASTAQTPLQRSHSSQRFETRSPLQQQQQPLGAQREAVPSPQQQYKQLHPPIHARIAPPGLAAPVMPSSSSSAEDTAQVPAPAPRGPPGIVLPGL